MNPCGYKQRRSVVALLVCVAVEFVPDGLIWWLVQHFLKPPNTRDDRNTLP